MPGSSRTKECRGCAREFASSQEHKVFCSDRCADLAALAIQRKKHVRSCQRKGQEPLVGCPICGSRHMSPEGLVKHLSMEHRMLFWEEFVPEHGWQSISTWVRSQIDATGECWRWTRHHHPNGYPLLKVAYRQVGVHRLILAIESGVRDLPFTCHHCDNPGCCNPAHLFSGSPQSNVDDMVAKGRQARGEKIGFSVLTEPQVMEIRSRALAGESHKSLAREFGVDRSNVGFICSGKTWKHLLQFAEREIGAAR
jgi:hypothetical protein